MAFIIWSGFVALGLFRADWRWVFLGIAAMLLLPLFVLMTHADIGAIHIRWDLVPVRALIPAVLAFVFYGLGRLFRWGWDSLRRAPQ